MIDDDEKIRRNLMAVSAVIIGTSWLDQSLPHLLERVFSVKDTVAVISEWKVWLALLALLGYLTLRYQWSDDVRKIWSEQAGKVNLRFVHLIQTRYFANVARWVLRGRYPWNSASSLKSIFDDTLAQVRPSAMHTLTSLRVASTMKQPSRRELEYEVRFAPTWSVLENGSSSQQALNPTKIPIDRTRRFGYVLRAYINVHAYSPISMHLLWPAGLCAVAVFIAAFRLATSLVR